MELDKKKRIVDKWLDAALTHYGSAEPDSDFEDRLLRKLRATPRRRTSRQLWSAWATAAAFVLIVAGVLIHYQHSGSNPLAGSNASRREPIVIEFPVRSPFVISTNQPDRKIHRPLTRVARHRWPAQFPTPQPLSDQERMFASYAERFPKEAMLTAQEHNKFEEVVRQAQEENQNAASHSNQER